MAEAVTKGMSQNSPVHSGKQLQVKFSPKSRDMQLPLLQSTLSHIDGGGELGEGETVSIIDDENNGMSQNLPVQPG